MKRTIILFLVLGSLFLAACSNSRTPAIIKDQSSNGSGYTDISVTELQAMMDEKEFAFVNVHVPFSGDIPQTDVSIPFDQIESNLDQLPNDKNVQIVLYCRSGSMSSVAAKTLVGLGYTNVLNLSGGFNAWERAGLPLEGQQ